MSAGLEHVNSAASEFIQQGRMESPLFIMFPYGKGVLRNFRRKACLSRENLSVPPVVMSGKNPMEQEKPAGIWSVPSVAVTTFTELMSGVMAEDLEEGAEDPEKNN